MSQQIDGSIYSLAVVSFGVVVVALFYGVSALLRINFEKDSLLMVEVREGVDVSE